MNHLILAVLASLPAESTNDTNIGEACQEFIAHKYLNNSYFIALRSRSTFLECEANVYTFGCCQYLAALNSFVLKIP